jgi:putative peptidoglycan lipid II flippase
LCGHAGGDVGARRPRTLMHAHRSAPGAPSRGLADYSLHRIIGGIAPVMVIVQAVGLLFSIALARILGSSTGTDAYFLALSVPAGVSMVMLAALRQGATPPMTESLARSEEEFAHAGSQLLSSVALLSAVLAALATTITWLGAPLAVGDGSPHFLRLVRADLIALAPLPVLGALTGALGAIQMVRGRVVPAVAVLGLEPAAKTVAVLTLGPSLGASALILGQLAGSVLAPVTLWVMLRRDGVGLRPARTVLPPFVRGVIRLSAPLIISQAVLQANPIVDRTMAASLGSGSVTQLELGVRLFFGATALIGGALVGPLTGAWSASRVHRGWEVVRVGVVRAVVAILVVVPPVITLGLALRRPVIDLIYGGGAYSDAALRVTADVFGMLMLGLPASVLIIVFSSLFVVQQSTVFPMLVGIANVVLNALLNFALRPILGAPGIALSTSLTLTVLVVPYAVSATKRWDLRLREALPSAARAAVAGATIALAAVALAAPPWGTSKAAAVVEVGVVSTVVIVLYTVILLVAREPLAQTAVDGVRHSRGRHTAAGVS